MRLMVSVFALQMTADLVVYGGVCKRHRAEVGTGFYTSHAHGAHGGMLCLFPSWKWLQTLGPTLGLVLQCPAQRSLQGLNCSKRD